MLSGETATGNYPVECVNVMNKVAIATENSIHYWKRFKNIDYNSGNFDYHVNMNYSVCIAATNINAKAIIAYTDTGDTSRTLSGFNPGCPIFAITQNERTYRQLGLCCNIIPKLFPKQHSIDNLIKVGIELLKEEKFLKEGDVVVIAGGTNIVQNFEVSENGFNKIMGGIVKI